MSEDSFKKRGGAVPSTTLRLLASNCCERHEARRCLPQDSSLRAESKAASLQRHILLEHVEVCFPC